MSPGPPSSSAEVRLALIAADRNAAQAAQAHLAKPVEPHELAAAVLGVLQ
jgi:hypothetical protein